MRLHVHTEACIAWQGADISRVLWEGAMWKLWGGSIVKACYFFVVLVNEVIQYQREEIRRRGGWGSVWGRKAFLFLLAHTLRNMGGTYNVFLPRLKTCMHLPFILDTYIHSTTWVHTHTHSYNPRPTCAGINPEQQRVTINMCQRWHTTAELRFFSAACTLHHVYADTWPSVLFNKMAALWPP